MLKIPNFSNVGLTLLLLAALPAAQAEPLAVAGFTKVKSLGGIDEYRLDANGLTVLIKPDHSAPVVTFQVTYHVGSRNEVTGTTGATHILEHMMFKGSEHYNKPAANGVDQYLGKVGAHFNATTSYDRTNYFATLGRENLEGYIAIEADRMRGLWLHEADRQKEMTVVRNEFERGENNPGSALEKEIWAMAYQAQPYHHPVIGWRSDIEQVPIEKLRQFYDTFYWPENATVSIIGDVERQQALSLVNKYYGAIPHSPRAIPEVYTEEPPQSGPRRLTLKRAGELGVVDIAWKGPAGRDSDLPALSVLGGILSIGANSRLSRALVDQSLATTTAADIDPMHDPALFEASATLTPGTTHEQAEAIILAEVDKVKREGVTSEEVQRAISQYRADQSFGRDGTAAIAAALNEWIAVGDWTLFVTNMDKIAKVTSADVRRVTKTYLNDDHSTTGWFVPTVEK
jgi:zinc protease